MYFSNQSKFNLFESDGINYVRRFQGEKFNAKCKKKTVKFGGGSVMVFGMFSYQGTTLLICLNTQVNATIYKNLLASHVLPALNYSDVKDPIFAQDNVPCHKAKSVLNFLKEKLASSKP